MQTILGAGGVIGNELAKALAQDHKKEVRLVSRTPSKVNDTDELVSADLTHPEEVAKAVKGSEVAYLTVGLPYKASVWESTWPKVMRSVLDACKQEGTKLVFFDNMYMYDPEHLGHMTEETPVNPVSRKGKVRARIAEMLMNEVEAGNLQAMIARSADFYGPQAMSVPMNSIYEPLSSGKKANWLGDVHFKHSCTYTEDAGKATALLGNTPDAYDQVWHLPTPSDPPTGKEWIEMFAKELNVEPRYMVGKKFMIRLMGIFVPVMREIAEMYYQFDRNYVFDSSKFDKRFTFQTTPYAEGVKKTVEKLA